MIITRMINYPEIMMLLIDINSEKDIQYNYLGQYSNLVS